MSIFNRLYNIAKAEVNARIRQGSPDSKRWTKRSSQDKNQSEDTSWGNSQEQQSSQSSYTPPPNNDPVADWYAALEIPYGSDWETIQKAWKSQLRKYHPDRHAQNDEKADIAHQVTQQLNEAYKGLKKHLGK